MLTDNEIEKLNNSLSNLNEDDVKELLTVLEKQYDDDKLKYDRVIREKHGGIFDHSNDLINNDKIVLDELEEKIKITKDFIDMNFENSINIDM